MSEIRNAIMARSISFVCLLLVWLSDDDDGGTGVQLTA